jgi:hypothetical protein
MLFRLVPERALALSGNAEMADFLVYRPLAPRQRGARIFRTDSGYRVRGEASEEELRAAGVRPDDVVEFES